MICIQLFSFKPFLACHKLCGFVTSCFRKFRMLYYLFRTGSFEPPDLYPIFMYTVWVSYNDINKIRNETL